MFQVGEQRLSLADMLLTYRRFLDKIRQEPGPTIQTDGGESGASRNVLPGSRLLNKEHELTVSTLVHGVNAIQTGRVP